MGIRKEGLWENIKVLYVFMPCIVFVHTGQQNKGSQDCGPACGFKGMS